MDIFSGIDFQLNYLLVRENTLCDLDLFNSDEICFIFQNMVQDGKASIVISKDCI